jgi:hypothetical protein
MMFVAHALLKVFVFTLPGTVGLFRVGWLSRLALQGHLRPSAVPLRSGREGSPGRPVSVPQGNFAGIPAGFGFDGAQRAGMMLGLPMVGRRLCRAMRLRRIAGRLVCGRRRDGFAGIPAGFGFDW